MKRIVVGMTGASGQVYGIRLLQVVRSMPGVETHLILSQAARSTMVLETDWKPQDVERLANVAYRHEDVGAAVASGSFPTDGMVVIPCSIKTLSAIAHSNAADLIARAADVQLKEGRPLVLAVRETPLHLGHLELAVQAARLGSIIFPPIPAFYGRPKTVDEIIDGTVGRILARLGIQNDLYPVWSGADQAAPPDQRSGPADDA